MVRMRWERAGGLGRSVWGLGTRYPGAEWLEPARPPAACSIPSIPPAPPVPGNVSGALEKKRAKAPAEPSLGVPFSTPPMLICLLGISRDTPLSARAGVVEPSD